MFSNRQDLFIIGGFIAIVIAVMAIVAVILKIVL